MAVEMTSQSAKQKEIMERLNSKLELLIDSFSCAARLTVDGTSGVSKFTIIPSNVNAVSIFGELLPRQVTLAVGAGGYRELWHNGGNIFANMPCEEEIIEICRGLMEAGGIETQYIDTVGGLAKVTFHARVASTAVIFSQGAGLGGLLKAYRKQVKHYEPYCR